MGGGLSSLSTVHIFRSTGLCVCVCVCVCVSHLCVCDGADAFTLM